MRHALSFAPLAALLLTGCLCNAMLGAAGAMKSKPTIADKAKLGALKSAALVGVCHMDEMGYRRGGTMARMAVGAANGTAMREAFASGVPAAFTGTTFLGLDEALAKAPPTGWNVAPHARCAQDVGPFGGPASSGAFDSIEPVLDTQRMKAAAEALGVDAVFAVMMVPGHEFDGGTSRVFSSGIIHSTVYGVDRTGQIIFQKAIDAAGEAPGTKDSDIAMASEAFGSNLAASFAKALAEAR